MKQILEFSEFCRNHIAENLPEWLGQEVYMCDLGGELTQGTNCDGTFTFSTSLAKDYLREWFDEAGEYWDYEKFNFGENLHNPFNNPEAYIVCMVIEGVNSILSQCAIVDEMWNDQVELTQELIDEILEQIADVDVRW